MLGPFYNRVAGRCAAINDKPLFGLWNVSASPELVFLNSVPVSGFDYVVPDLSGRWSLIWKEHGEAFAGSFQRSQIADDLEGESVRGIGERLRTLEGCTGWLPWTDVPPLVPGISERADLQPLERAIIRHCGHLEHVCHQPKSTIYHEVERVYASAARRIPAKAISYLSAHSEDWERPTLRGVLPKRILAELRDEQFDIYENRVAVRLVDHLNEYLDRRAYELRRICRLFEERSNYSSEARGAHRRSDRICRLWGELIDSNLGQQKAEKTRKEIESLKYRLLGLKDSFLYQRVPVRSSVPNELKMTNLLANDSDYREISLLWSEWSRHGLKVRSSPKQVYSRQQDFCRGFERFCVLVTLRALEQLRLGPAVQDCGTPIGTRSGESLRLPFGLSITPELCTALVFRAPVSLG